MYSNQPMYSNQQQQQQNQPMYSDQQEQENSRLTDGDYESSGSDSGDKKEGSNLGLACCCLYCCCIFCIVPMIMSIAAAVNSKGFTSCAVPSLANATEIPNYHSISTPHYQWSNFYGKTSNVFNLNVSNTSRIGYWRTTKTWYLRDQWAYVQEGGTAPDIVAWTPFSSWQRTFYVKHCGLGAEYSVAQNRYGPWRWGAAIEQWQIYFGVQSIATATHVKEHQYWGWQIPNGWQATVTSNQFGGATIADMIQTYDSLWVQNSLWIVKDYRPDIIGAWVISFMAVVTGEKGSGNHNDNYRRLRAAGKDGESAEIEGLEDGEAVV